MAILDENITSNLKNLRAAYKGRKLSEQAIAGAYGAYYHKDLGEIVLDWEETDSWTGDAVRYSATVYVDPELVVKSIAALHCELLRGDDARGSTYVWKRADDLDYFRLDCQLEDLLEEI